MKKVREVKDAKFRRVTRGVKMAKKKDYTNIINMRSRPQNTKQTTKENENNEKIINTKSIIICEENKVKRYAELIKNSDMRPIAVIAKKGNVCGKQKLTAKSVIMCIIVGLILGFVNGFLGGGGGMLCVPLLVFALGLTDKRAHATAILVMLPISLVSFVVYAFNMSIEWELALWVVLGSVAGGLLGSILLKKISNSWLRAIFALIMIIAGVRMVL